MFHVEHLLFFFKKNLFLIETNIKNIINSLPEKPGIYQYFNIDNEIIYIGKAKNLKRRVSSYFNKDLSHSRKTQILVNQIRNIKFIIVDSEEDALLLENNLIKRYKPKYNILLKDDKTYPSICITKEEYPRIFKTREINKKGGEYFGPYSSVYVANSFIKILQELYPIRSCNLSLNKNDITKGKYKCCLDYHIKKCKAPCEGKQSYEEYNEMISIVKELLKGNIHSISEKMMNEMKKLSEEFRFEEAEEIKKKFNIVEKYKAKSIVVSQINHNIDVFGYEENEKEAYINILRVVKGSIVQGLTISYKKKLDESKEEILGIGIAELRERLESKSPEILVPFLPNVELKTAEIIIPQRGEKKHLLDLSVQNAKQYKLNKQRQEEKLNPDQKAIKLLTQLQKKLGLKNIPIHIECFDNSNIQGSDAIGACVVFKKAKACKKEYRTYNIKNTEGNDDYGSMKEVVRRRYERLLKESAPLPDLIIADGGKGQMEVIRQIIEDELHLSIPIAGLAKNSLHKTNELLFGFPPAHIEIKRTEELFRFLAHIQDEVHRFAITTHRKKRSKNQTTSELDKIKGIGEKTKNLLLNEFKSIKRIKNTDKKNLEKIIGNNRASVIYDYFHKENL
ncbi:MAG: excinuclease ABC subunit C [Paludibacteraceae bacterium]|nr:excinuclease ABC subunit C [Paludibacteraceae bacterium]